MQDSPIPTQPVLAELVTLSIYGLMKVLGLRRTSIWKLRQQPDFPRPVMLTHNLSWRAVDIQQWLKQRLAQAGNAPAQQQPQS